jgi:hypothetical protein
MKKGFGSSVVELTQARKDSMSLKNQRGLLALAWQAQDAKFKLQSHHHHHHQKKKKDVRINELTQPKYKKTE